MIKYGITIYIMTLSLFSLAQTSNQDQSASSSQAKGQSIDFEDELVEGTAQNPDLFYLFQKKDVGEGKFFTRNEKNS